MVAELSPGDAGWAAAMMERRRREYARYSPVFWRPAEGVVPQHERFLRGRITAETTVALRTEYGFIIAERRHAEAFVDDYAVVPPGTWDDDGAALLLAAAGRFAHSGVSAIRVVTANADEAKAGMLASLSLSLVERWWVRELRPAGEPPAPAGRVSGPGFSGYLGPAPPVYAPGGLVFQADRAGEGSGARDADAIARGAAAMGAVLAVLPLAPGAPEAGELPEKGWTIASDWYLGWPLSPGRSGTATGSSRR